MKRYWAYFKYIISHKLAVIKVGKRMLVPMMQLIMHDMSKFSPYEFVQYAQAFYDADGKETYINHDKLDYAWNHHLKRNPHHWNYWVLHTDDGEIKALPIPEKYLREMAADMLAMDITNAGDEDALTYFNRIKDKIIMTDMNKEYIKTLLEFYRLK